MKRILVSLLAVTAVAVSLGAVESMPRLVIAFHTMYGVDGPFLGGANAIRGIPGDDLPWEVEHFVNGSLSTTGRLHILVRGLVFKDTDEVPAELRGINDESDFRGVVSCLTEADTTTPVVNVVTAGFRATRSGNANIDAKVELPNPCVAPVIFVTGDDPTKWFAVTGFEKEEADE
jgi:hypothetical protein